MVDFLFFILIGIFFYVLPGFILVEFLLVKGHLGLMVNTKHESMVIFENSPIAKGHLSLMEKVGLASSLSLSIYPLTFLWSSFFGLKLKPLYLLVPAAIILTFVFKLSFDLIKKYWPKSQLSSVDLKVKGFSSSHGVNGAVPSGGKLRAFFFNGLGILIIWLIFFVRWLAIKGMLAPAWGDSVHHALIIKLILKNGGLFKSWSPYAPIESLNYHFGLHADVACWAWLSGQPAHRALLEAGQFLNGLCVLALFPLALKLGGKRWVAWGALGIAAFLFPFPGYFVNWGRYTQLAAMIILPGFIWLIDEIFEPYLRQKSKKVEESKNQSPIRAEINEKKQASPLFFLALLLAGLFLTHYMIFILALTSILARLILAMAEARFKLKFLWPSLVKTGIAGLATFVLILPWLWIFKEDRLGQIFFLGRSKQNSLWLGTDSDLAIWSHLDFYFADFFWVLGLVSLLLAFIFRKKLAWFFSFWGAFSLAVANWPAALLPGRRMVTNDILVFSLFIPISILIAWLVVNTKDALINRVIFFRKQKPRLNLTCLVLSIGLFLYGAINQAKIVNPFFQMVTGNDIAAFDWIRKNTTRKDKFLINGFLIYKETAAAGSDAGWWLPYFTGRKALIPPLVYYIEKLSANFDRNELPRLIKKIRESQGNSALLKEVMKEAGYKYIFLGEKRGTVCYDAGELISESSLRGKKEFKLLFKQGRAQIWQVID